MRKTRFCIFIFLTFSLLLTHAQQWSLKLSSNVEMRTWKLTNKAEKKEKSLTGASIMLYKGTSLIGQTTSNDVGDFVIDVPAHGDFILTVSFSGCNTKKFYVSTNGVPENVGKDNYKPTIMIGGFIMSKPISGVDYLGLNEPLVKVEYKEGGQNFDKDDKITNNGINIVSRISASEDLIIEKFCSTNKQGDEALAKKKCELAKQLYTKAKIMLPEEKYPVEQLEKVEDCLKHKKSIADAAAENATASAELAKIANDKAIKEKEAKANASFKKPVAEKKPETKPKPTKETAIAVKPAETNSESEPKNSANVGKSKYKMPAKIGKDVFKETTIKADGYFKTKRYDEAKKTYEDALKLKDKDVYTINKIAECNKLIDLQKTK